MLLVRLYIAALTLLFLLLVVSQRSVGVLEATIITSAIVYLILDVRTELESLKREFELLQELEQEVSALLRLNT
jgi:hypothetical protein